MRSEALNTNIVQLVCLYRIIIQDGEGQQGGICCGVVNLKNDAGKVQ